ncbi:phage tail protein [Paraburkholderia sp. Tr-20389]|uniref:C40 family peptidase n=1 Tax=Paraburkholderia sp. Tr-20389 TaxID=2703903 RepID=UPI00197F06A9|nr:C40 family peptidase [Paraburkholderia sp. Tr-20389]MBN3758154.1 phage tail protein [Paraburkholderia sp. Tr-20389]
MIDPNARCAIEAHARRAYPHECCGVVVNHVYFACRNVAADPTRDFVVDAADYAAAEDRGTIEAIVHSHPDRSARPTMADLAACQASDVRRWIIVSVVAEHGVPSVQEWREFETADDCAPLIGCEFAYGSNDCYGIVRRYYKAALQIELPDYLRPDRWWKDGLSNLYVDHYREAGFCDMSASQPRQVGDVLLMRIASKVPNHAAIYIGNDEILHHLWGQLSRREALPRYRNHITHVLRHRTLL